MFIRSANNYDRREASRAAGVENVGRSRTIQSAKSEVDINNIVRRYLTTGSLPMRNRVPLNVDFDEVVDFRSALDFVNAAKRSFESLPSEVRKRFNNDAAAFCDFAEDAENLPQLRKWGLAPAVAEPSPAPEPAPAG